MADPEKTAPSEATSETPAQQQERVSRRRQAAELKRRTKAATSKAFDTRTERWRQVGLAGEVERLEARKALGGAAVFALLLIAVLVAFGFRQDLFPGAGKAVRFATAGLLVILGWGLARTAGRGIAPMLMRRMDPAAAGTMGFLFRLMTIVGVVLGSLAIAGVKPQALAVGGAFTAVIIGLAAQQTLGNLIAGATLLSARPFRVADRIAVHGSGYNVEGIVASLGLFYTTLLSGEDRVMIPNSTLMTVAVIPRGEPEPVQLQARFRAAVTPQTLKDELEAAIDVPLVRPPQVDMEELDSDGLLTLRISATPIDPANAPLLASEVLTAIRAGGGEGEQTPAEGHPPVGRTRYSPPGEDPGVDGS